MADIHYLNLNKTEKQSSYQMQVLANGFCYVYKTYDNGTCNKAILGYIVNGVRHQQVHTYRNQNPPSQWKLCHAKAFAESVRDGV